MLCVAVQDIMKKEEGKYVKYAMGHTLQMGYQVSPRHTSTSSVSVAQQPVHCDEEASTAQELCNT